jgi:AcrR family transcriptional regulator
MARSDPAKVELPPAPDAALDRYLDALARVVVRHGFSRASVPDVAADLGVSRVTVYRHAGNIEQMVQLLVVRELNRLMNSVTAAMATEDGTDALLDLMTEVVTFVQSHPVVAKILADEPGVIGPFLVRRLRVLLRWSTAISSPLLQSLMADGRLAVGDPAHLADWLGRIVVTTIIAPPPGSIRDYLEKGLRPLLEPPVAARMARNQRSTRPSQRSQRPK